MAVNTHLASEHVGIVSFSNPPHNFFDLETIQSLVEAYRSLAQSHCRAIVLCSDGKHFCAGANFRRPAAPAQNVPLPAPVRHLYEVAIELFEQPLPVVAAIQGAAVGGGLGLALSADFRVTTADARWVANFSHVGFHHGFGLTATLPPLVGQQTCLDMLYNSREFSGTEALSAGLCDRVVNAEELRSVAVDMAGELALAAPLALRSIRATLRSPLIEAVRATVVRERSEQERLRETLDFKAGVAARRGELPKFVGQ